MDKPMEHTVVMWMMCLFHVSSCHWLSKITKKSFAIFILVKYAEPLMSALHWGKVKGKGQGECPRMFKSVTNWLTGIQAKQNRFLNPDMNPWNSINRATYVNHWKTQKCINSYIWGKQREEKGKYEMSVVSRFPGGGTIVLVRTAFSSLQTSKKR